MSWDVSEKYRRFKLDVSISVLKLSSGKSRTVMLHAADKRVFFYRFFLRVLKATEIVPDLIYHKYYSKNDVRTIQRHLYHKMMP